MFTGIIEKNARVIGVAEGPRFRRLTLSNDWPDVKIGESVAVNGCCLTVAQMSPGELGFDVIAETLARTNLGLLGEGDAVHVERALRVGDRIDGHFVQGHIDAAVPLLDRVDNETEVRLRIAAPAEVSKYLIPQGSMALDGVSLTVAAVARSHFEVALIPTTLRLTALSRRQPPWPFNLEVDILSKTVVNYLERTQT